MLLCLRDCSQGRSAPWLDHSASWHGPAQHVMEGLDNLDLGGKAGKEYIGQTLYRQSGKASGLGGHEWASRLKGISYLICGESCGYFYGPDQEHRETR